MNGRLRYYEFKGRIDPTFFMSNFGMALVKNINSVISNCH